MPTDPRFQKISYFQRRFKPISTLKLTGHHDVVRKVRTGLLLTFAAGMLGVVGVTAQSTGVVALFFLMMLFVGAGTGKYARTQAKLAADEWNVRRQHLPREEPG